jgi:hypothetical protein
MNGDAFEFLTMVRGCGLVSLQLHRKKIDVSFSISPHDHFHFMESRLNNLPTVDADLLKDSASSISTLIPLCRALDAHMSFCNLLRECVETVCIDSRKGEWKELHDAGQH